MADVNIGAKLTVDTGASLKSINDINKEIKSASEALKEAKIGTDDYKAAQDRLKAAQQELSASTKEKTSTFAQLKDQLKGTVPAFDGAAQGASGLGKQLLALLANPIVLMIAGVVAGLKFLYDAFTYSVEGGNKVKAMFAGINAGVSTMKQSGTVNKKNEEKLRLFLIKQSQQNPCKTKGNPHKLDPQKKKLI